MFLSFRGRDRSNGPLNTQPSLVFEGFQRLLRLTDQGTYHGTEAKPICLDEVCVEEKKELLKRLHSVCLPLLDGQIIKLVDMLSRFHLREERLSDSTLQPILDMQSALQDNIGEIRSALDIICPEPLLGKNLTEYTDDQDLEEFKAFRLKGLDQYLRIDLPRSLFAFFAESLQIIEPQSVSGVFPRSFPILPPSLSSASSDGCSNSLTDHASSSRDLIKMTMEWIVGSEYENIQQLWLHEVVSIDKALVDSFERIKPPHNEQACNHQSLQAVIGHSQADNNALRGPVIQVTKALIPVLKLSRMFFKKSSQGAMSKNRLPYFTQMDSNQLDCMSSTAPEVRSSLVDLLGWLRSSHQEYLNSQLIISKADKIRISLEHGKTCVLLHFVPLVGETHAFPDQKEYKHRFIVWSTQLNMAIQNLIKVAGFLPDNRTLFLDETIFPRVPLCRQITRRPPSLQRITGRSPLVLSTMGLHIYFQRAERAAAGGAMRVEE